MPLINVSEGSSRLSAATPERQPGAGTSPSAGAFQPTYSFNGQTYKTEKEANVARDQYIAERKSKAAALYADAASVGFDKGQFDALLQSGGGLSQMSDEERSFIQKRYQASNPYKREAYTASEVDQYLASVGMPSAKELDTYRKAYYDYASGGGVLENYPSLDDDAYDYISRHWKDGMQTGINGKLYNAKGKEIAYTDTLLDEQLQKIGLPPASLMNDYFLDYQKDKQVSTDINDFYAAVYDRTKNGMGSEEAYRTTLQEPKYRRLQEYVSEAVAYPSEADYTDNAPLSETYGQVDKAKYDAAWEKANAANAKRDALDHRVSYADYENYAAMEAQQERGKAQTERYKAAQENAAKWLTRPATGDAEKEQRSTEMQQFLRVFGDGTRLSDMQTYFSLLDAGVPYQTITAGPAAISAWNDTKNVGSASYADVKLLTQGYSEADGDYVANRKIVQQTKEYSSRSLYDLSKSFDVATYEKQVSGVGSFSSRVTPEGAIYAAVNGKDHAPVQYAESEPYSLYTLVTTKDANGKRLSDYMTDEERGVFNYLFRREGVNKSMEYLDGLSGMLEDRRYADRTGTFAMRLATDGVNVSEGEIADYYYDAYLYQEAQALENIKDGKNDAWHRDAWQQYANYSDEALARIAESENAPKERSYWEMVAGAQGMQPDMSATIEGAKKVNAAQWVLDTRKKLRTEANIAASLYGYTDEAGKAATEAHDYASEIVPDSPENMPDQGFAAWSPEYGNLTNDEVAAEWQRETEKPLVDQMTAEMRDRYNWLYATKGPEAAQAYYQMLRPDLDAAAEGKVKADQAAFAKGSGWKEAGVSLLSIPANIFSGIAGVSATAMNLITGTDPTRTQAASLNVGAGWREAIAEDMSFVGSLAYQTIMSMGDSAAIAALAAVGVPAGLGTALLASSAYTPTLNAALDRGLDPASAYSTALVAGLAEYVTEKVSLDALLEGIEGLGKNTAKSFTRQWFENTAKQAFVEGSEEVNSDIINFLWDNLVNGDMSEFNQNVDRLIDAGYSKEEARQVAWRNQIMETALSFAGGAVSGGVMAGGGGLVKAALLDYAGLGPASQAGTSAPASAQTGASVHVHADAYAKGRAAVDRIFGQDAGNAVQFALDNRESEGDAKRIDAISGKLAGLDNTSYLYGYTHDADGNFTLTSDEQTALAATLALAFDDADENNIDAAFTHLMASLQSDQQRAGNTNYEWIKTAQDTRNIRDQIAKTQEAISTIETEQQNKLDDARTAYRAAAAEVSALTKKIKAATSIKQKNTLLTALKAAQEKKANLKGRLTTIEVTDAATAKSRVQAAKEEIARQQTLLDRHYASASAFLSEYAPAAFSGVTSARSNAAARANDVGGQIDAVMASDMSDSDKDAALAPLREQQWSATSSVRAIDARLSNADPAALTNAMNAIKTNAVQDFVRSQNEAAQQAAESARGSETKEDTDAGKDGENKAAESVKQDSTAQSKAEEKKTVTIGPRVQQTFNRIAKKFGCEIVWGDDSTAIGKSGQTLKGRNGAYNPDEPNKIYLNRTMVANKGMSSTQVVAREFFTHEVTHYVANTKTFRSIMAKAAMYYNAEYKDRGGVDALVNAMVEDEQRRGNNGFGRSQALEEMTAHFVQEVLFADESGTRRALVWLARSDSNMVNNFLNTVEYLIKRGNVRKASDGNTVKTMLIDAEFELINALRERQYLDRNGKTSAFQGSSNTQAKASGDVANSRQGMDIEDYAKEATVRIDDDTELARLIDNRGNASVGSVIADYIMNVFGGQTITMSDGREVIVDRHDAKKLSQYPKPRKTAEISNMRRIIDAARYDHSVHTDSHRKFTDFYYYVGNVLYNDVLYGVELSVGTAKNDKTSHLYDIRDWNKNGTAGSSETNSPMPGQATGVSNTSGSFDGSITAVPGSVKPSDSVTPTETVSNVRDIYTGKGKGHSGVMNSRGMTTDEYMAMDFSKNKLLQKNGKPYKALYSGSPYTGFTIFDTGYADDGLSNFATSSKRIAQSYTLEGEMAPEYDPRNADREREQMGTNGEYLSVNESGRYDRTANATMYRLLNRMADWVFSKDNDEMQELDFAAQSIEDDELRQEAMQGVEAGALINYAVSRLASRHSASDFAEVQKAYQIIAEANEHLMPAAKDELELVRKAYTADDFRVDSEKPMQDTPILAVSSYLRTLQTGIEDALLNSGIYDVMQQADLGVDPGEKMYVGFDSLYKGKARLFSEQETWDRLPTYEGEPGYYKLKVYAENPLDVDVQDQNWDNMDVASFPSDVREKLADLYGYKLSYKTREVSRAAYETGYDAVVFRGLHDTNDMDLDEASDVIITYKPYQSKSIYNMSPTTNPDIMFSTGMSIDDYISRYGQKEQNAFGQRNNIRTPNNVDNDAGRMFRVSDTAQTLKEVAHIRQSARDVIDEGILQQADGLVEMHGFAYEPVTLDRMRELGQRYIAEHGGLTNSMRVLTDNMPEAKASQLVEYMSAANQVFTEIGAEGKFDPKEYYEFVASYVEMRSTWGRVGRVMQLVNDSPLGRVTYWQRVVQRINETNDQAVRRGLNPLFYRDGAPVIAVPQSFFDALAQASTQEEIDAAEYAITEYIGQNSPLTVSNALRNWRYFAMLANPVTHMRNVLGNATMLGGRIMKDTIAAGMENLAVRRGRMSADERTHAVTLGQDAATRDFVRQLWEDNADAVQSGGRDGFKQDLQEATPKSPIRVIDRMMRWNGEMLEREDRIFLGATFRAAAAQYIQAQGLDVNNLTREQRGAIVNYATQQAQEATYRDASRLADAINRFAKSGWAAQLFFDAVIPFKKTPINIFKRGLEYSPAGIARGLVDIARNATARSRGEQPVVSASVVVDELAKGLTGSMLALLGFFLSKAGILKVKAGDDDKDSAFERDIGRQDYSLEIGDVSVKIESLAPLTFPLFMGAQLQRLTSDDKDGLSVSDLTDSLATLADPLMDMSFMSSLNSVLETYNENKLGGVAVNATQAYLGQYLPTIGSKVNQTVNKQRRTSKASQASPVGTSWDYWLRSMASKIPGVNQAALEPYVKTTGQYDEKDSFGDYVLSVLNNFVSPVNIQAIDATPVNAEISRLVSVTGSTEFVPQNPKKYLNIGNERYNMTAKEYTQYSKDHNETVYAVLSQVIQSDAYARATDEQRVQMLGKAYDRAHKTMMDKYKSVFAQK